MRRFVLDTDVIVAAMRSPSGASSALLGAVLDHQIAMIASVPLFFEYESKCTSPIHWTAAGLTQEQAHIFLYETPMMRWCLKRQSMDVLKLLLLLIYVTMAPCLERLILKL